MSESHSQARLDSPHESLEGQCPALSQNQAWLGATFTRWATDQYTSTVSEGMPSLISDPFAGNLQSVEGCFREQPQPRQVYKPWRLRSWTGLPISHVHGLNGRWSHALQEYHGP